MEMRDVYLRDGAFTGLSIEKHAQLEKGQYLLHAIIILKTMDGKYIMQQRSLKARHYPGEWDVTGGGVTAGETSAQAAVREAMEELGVEAKPENVKHMLRYVTEWGGDTGMICDTYAARVEISEGGMKVEKTEVNDVKVVDFDEFYAKVMYNKTGEFGEMLRRVDAEI